MDYVYLYPGYENYVMSYESCLPDTQSKDKYLSNRVYLQVVEQYDITPQMVCSCYQVYFFFTI